MVMEAEVPGLLKLGFSSVLVVAFGIILILRVKTRNGGYGWLFAHLLFFSWALIGVFEVLGTRGDPNASSIDNSLKLAWSAVLWAIGMICFLVGAMLLRPRKMQ